MAKKTYIKKQSIKEEKSIVNNILEKKIVLWLNTHLKHPYW